MSAGETAGRGGSRPRSRRGVRGVVPELLRDTVFRRYWGASTISMFGDQVSSIAVPLRRCSCCTPARPRWAS